MRLNFTKDDEAFRHRARDWLIANVPRERAPHEGMPARRFSLDWLSSCHEGGWAGIGWPAEYGGQGLPPDRLVLWYEEYVRARAPSILDCTFVALNHAGPTLIACGTEEQKAFHLPLILSGRSIWCQGFSEPGSGSDLASLSTTGTIDGDHLVVNGQKIWTSFADIADYQELLIRTDPGSKRHKGLSWVICDMTSPGITVRPIENMAGVSHFAEVFYDDVCIPLSNVVGALHDGWSVAMTTLAFERKTAAMGLQLELSIRIEDLIALAEPLPGTATYERLSDLRAETAALRAMTYRTLFREPRTASDGSLVRLYFAELAQRIHRATMDVLGPAALVDSAWTHDYLESYSETIAGGAAEIQRNIIAERILGLPRE
ncbi:acyl-CoA dehydrogenase family protein [Aquamicrobium sp. LC103]|uniref:acyl-CoA dehydrogenase family protein n=1 Tax=Aquamicrobium sp. LC103 TaxID=1120658 RepID=UPI00063ECB05|nr:acyl-CoA dehydrogenase family protein [Aquamicrobium sp. LC103]TKT78378.1 acyl-CoA dehydrogenase [Aquamicrobium sp. LC103]